MGVIKITDLCITSLQRIKTEGGDVLHAMKEFDNGFVGFGEAYFSWITAGAIKGWKRHTRMTMNLVVPVGQVCFVFYGLDQQGTMVFRVEHIGDIRYARVTVPPGIWFAFQGIGSPQSLILNIANIPHESNEVERLSLNEIKYAWS